MTTHSAIENLSRSARAFHDEYWEWLWHGEDCHRTIGDKKAELRTRYGKAAEDELLNALREAGFSAIMGKKTAPADDGFEKWEAGQQPGERGNNL